MTRHHNEALQGVGLSPNNKMESSTAICRIISLVFAIVSLSLVQGDPQIVDPFPDNVHAIEYETAKVSCSVADTDPSKTPDKIEFYRKGKFGQLKLIKDEGKNGRIYYDKKLEGKTLTTTLHFNNVTQADDSEIEGYECYGFTGKEKHGYGFTVTVITREELPGVEVSDDKVVKFGDNIVLSCNLTTNSKHQKTTLSRLFWKKDGVVIDEVLYPKEQSLKSRAFEVTSPLDGGIYSCHLISVLRDATSYNITGNITVTVEPKFFASDLKDNEVIVKKGDKATMVCSARGNPITIIWKKQLKTEGDVNSFNLAVNHTDYKFYNLDKLEDQTLEVLVADYSHRGKYYCCVQPANSTLDEDDVDGCQVFTLRVKDSAVHAVDHVVNASVRCHKDAMYIDLDRKALQGYNRTNLSLKDASCRSTSNKTHYTLRAPLLGCGTDVKFTKEAVVYSNTVKEYRKDGIITRIHDLRVPFRCFYTNEGVTSTFGILPTKVRRTVQVGNGTTKFELGLSLYRDQSYVVPFGVADFPLRVTFNKPLFIQVKIDSPDKRLTVMSERCYATPTQDPHHPMQYNVIVHGCAVDPTVTFYKGPHTVKRFSVKAFQFVGQEKEFVYLHCHILVCNVTDHTSRCAQGCLSVGRSKRAAAAAYGPTEVELAQGPFILEKRSAVKKHQTGSTFKDHIWIMVGMAVVCMLCLVAVVYMKKKIHQYHRKPAVVPRAHHGEVEKEPNQEKI